MMARKLDQILIVDVESTCWEGEPPEGEESEIIEIGLCPVERNSLSRIDKHSILVKPERSSISPFCTELTTLVPEMFAEAGTLADACKTNTGSGSWRTFLANQSSWRSMFWTFPTTTSSWITSWWI